MKKMSFTNSSYRNLTSLFGRAAFLVLFAWCFSMNAAYAQTPVEMRADSVASTPNKIAECTDDYAFKFTDDNGGDAVLYSDAAVDADGEPIADANRRDTTTFCPEDEWHRIEVVFTEFSLDTLDSLLVYDGNIDSLRADNAPLIEAATGEGVSKAFGGWVNANCDPAINASGCLTFVFKTVNDSIKGTGWEAWVKCDDRGLDLQQPENVWGSATCQLLPGVAPVVSLEIPAALLTANGCAIADSSVIVNIVNVSTGDTCVTDTIIAGTKLANQEFAIGTYKVTHVLLIDAEKKKENYIYVAGPSLTCNDEVNVSIGGGCKVVLDADNLLEAPCDTNMGVSYTIEITVGGTTITSDAADKLGDITIDRTMLGDLVCEGTQLTATITRTFDYSNNTGLMCAPANITESCKVKINVADDTPPIFDRQGGLVDTLIGCDFTMADFEKLLTKPGVIDNCGFKAAVPTIVADEDNERCDNVMDYIVTWNAEDNCGKKATAIEDTIRVIRPTDDVFFVDAPNPEGLDCSAQDAGIDAIIGQKKFRPGIRRARIKGPDTTYIDTLRLSEEIYVCNYILTKDVVSVEADCGKKTFVTWKLVDWCNPAAPSTINTQLIKYTDTEVPTFEAGIVSYEYAKANPIALPHFKCYLDKSPLPTVIADDNCDDNPEETMENVQYLKDNVWTDLEDSEGNSLTTLGAAIAAQAIDCDTFRVAYMATDECHEQTDIARDTSYFVVIDDTRPSAITVDQLNVSLPNEWGARIYVKDVDAGSWDACGLKSKQIRIKGSGDDYADFVDIGCQYLHPNVQIELRVIDNKDNENTAWLDVNVEDKIAPVCENLAQPRPFYCDEFHNDELGAPVASWTTTPADVLAKHRAYFGTFDCYDNLDSEECDGFQNEVEQYRLTEWPCGKMEIERRYQVQDWQPNTSVNKNNANDNWAYQTINIEYRANWSFTLPSDESATCAVASIENGVVVNNGACDLVGVEYEDKTYRVSGEECYKIERTYHIINWCAYNAGDDAEPISRVQDEHGVATGRTITSAGFETKGYFTYVQILKVSDNTAPVVSIKNPPACITAVGFDAPPYGEEDDSFRSAPYECDQVKEWEASAEDDCNTEFEWVGYLKDANGVEVPGTRTNTNIVSYVVLPGESYTAEFWAYDPCGNSGGNESESVKFKDCKKPAPYLLNGVAVELMATEDGGEIQIWATDLNEASFDNCTDQSFLDFRIWHEDVGEAPVGTGVADALTSGVIDLPKVITLGCDRVGTQSVAIYVIDETGNWDFATTYVIVQDNMGACAQVNEGGMVAGRIVDGNGENVQSVSIAVNGADQKVMTTSANGQYQFVLPMGGDYTVTPQKDMNPLNGVSTFDLVLISKHILGITQFDTPYKYIAADVNKSGSITAFDMVQLRQLILNITSEFPNNDSWRFVEGGYTFTSANPAAESFNEFMSINDLSADMPNMDFTAVKVGDVNGTALANSLLGAESRTTNGTLNLNVTDRFVEAGQTVTVAFTSADIAGATGYQFTLNVAGTATIVEGVAKAANFNTNLAGRGVIATSWNGEATANDVLFALTFTPNTTGLLSEMVGISSDVTAAEAYNTAGELLNVGINFNSAATAAGFELNQNTPNPFNGATTIGFNLPAAGTATLTVMDVQGKVLRSIKADYAKGANQVSLNANELGATGVLYYQLESADNVATKKMIIIE